MFEQYAVAHRPARRSRAGLFVLGSVLAHGGLVAALLVSAMWQIDKLRPEETAVVMGGRAGIPDLPPGEPAPARKLDRPRVRVARDLTQRDRQAEVAPPDATTGDDGDGDGDGDGPGDGAGGGGGLGVGALPCESLPCDGLDRVAAPRPAEPREVRPNLIEGHRIKGDPRIMAPDPVRLAMMRAGTSQLIGVVRMCLDRGGRVSSLELARSTGHEAYDARLLAEMRGWRYRPYRLDSGDTVAVCTTITFVYRMK
jgi:TonB family protein